MASRRIVFGWQRLDGGGGVLIVAGPGTVRRDSENADGLRRNENAQRQNRGLPGHAPGSEHLIQPQSCHGIHCKFARPALPDKAAQLGHRRY